MQDAETSMKTQPQLDEHQFSKPQYTAQPQISQQQNPEQVQKMIKKYQTKISQMLKIIKAQKNTNQNLKSQLKALNQNLNNVISKLNHKTLTQKQKQPKQESIRKQLQNQIKKNVALQKQLNQLRVRLKSIDTQRIQEMQSELAEKNRKIEELLQNVKMYERIEKQERNMDVYRKEEELVAKVSSLNEEILHLKGKIAKMKKNQEMQEKMMKRQHQQILGLQAKNVNNTGNASANRQLSKSPQKDGTFQKSQSSTKIDYLKQKYAVTQSLKPQNDKNISATSPQNPKQKSSKKSQREALLQKITQLQQKCQNLQITKKSLQRHYKFQTESLKSRIKTLQIQLSQLQSTLKRKDQQANILSFKIKQSQRKNYSTLQPLQKQKQLHKEKIKLSQDFTASTIGLFDQRKEFRGLVHVQGSTSYKKFDDTLQLSLEKNYRIKGFTFEWLDEYILGLETRYELRDGVEKVVKSFRIQGGEDGQRVKKGGLQLSDFQYIKEVQLYCGKFIQFIRIRTSRDKVLEVGNQKNHTKCKKFQFDIRTNQKPIAFLGAIDNKKILGSQGNRQLLISFGLQIKKKDVVGKSRYNPSRTTSLVKNSSKSTLQYLGQGQGKKNDKNVIEQQS